MLCLNPQREKFSLQQSVLFSISLILIPSNVYAEEINVESVGLDKTTIMTLTNVGTEDVQNI